MKNAKSGTLKEKARKLLDPAILDSYTLSVEMPDADTFVLVIGGTQITYNRWTGAWYRYLSVSINGQIVLNGIGVTDDIISFWNKIDTLWLKSCADGRKRRLREAEEMLDYMARTNKTFK